MSSNEIPSSHTQHAFLVAWGRFAQEIGLIQSVQKVPLKQKKYTHTAQTKVLEFFVAHLAGYKHLQEISLSAHPLDKDQAVAIAWGQSSWADYSGVSRTLSQMSWAEAEAIVTQLQAVSQPFRDKEIQLLIQNGQRLEYDGDLTGLPVSSTSQSYPNAAFGHMDDNIYLGYQAAVVTVQTPTYGRLWLSAAHHPGDTVSSTQAEALVKAAEAQTGLRPRRRVELLQQRLHTLETHLATIDKRQQKQVEAVRQAQATLADLGLQEKAWQQAVADLEKQYQRRQRPERPTSRLAQSRQRLQLIQTRIDRWQKRLDEAQRRLSKTEAKREQQKTEQHRLAQRLAQFEQDNAINEQPIQASFRLDAGFGTYENVALLVEMGYEVYTKPLSHQVVKHLKVKVTETTEWTRVGQNAEMVAWPAYQFKGCPYPLDVALERFYTGKTIKYSGLLHFGADPVTQDLPLWFDTYNRRQTIEAGIKEGKQVFQLHRLKVRSEPAIYLQEQFVIFAANFIRWATHWLAQAAIPLPNALAVTKLGVKKQVQVAAHVSAEVSWDSDGWLLTFSEYSAFAGKVLKLPGGGLPQPPPPTRKFVVFKPFSMKSPVVAQPLG